MLPLLKGNFSPEERTLFWEHMGNRAVRKGNFKLVSQFKKDGFTPWELYDLSNDRSETNDLSADNAAKVEDLSNLYQDWASNHGVVDWREFKK